MLNSLSRRIKTGLNITAVSTSLATAKSANSLGIKISKLNEIEKIDITIDGADEVDENLNGIKGGGGALLYEKIIASNSKKNIWIVDSTKLVKTLGKFPLPVEVVQFGSGQLFKKFEEHDFNPIFRQANKNRYITDNNNFIIDLKLEKIDEVKELDIKLKNFPGVVETGLFYNVADIVLAGIGDSVQIFDKKKRAQN
jgi:ribose 5-phosphate isomerase A